MQYFIFHWLFEIVSRIRRYAINKSATHRIPKIVPNKIGSPRNRPILSNILFIMLKCKVGTIK